MNGTSADSNSEEEITLALNDFHDEEASDKQTLTGYEHLQSYLNEEGNEVIAFNGWIKGKSFSKNVVNLLKRKVTKAEVWLLSKELKYALTSNHIKKGKLKKELEEYARMLCLKWNFWTDEKDFHRYKFRPKFTFNPRSKDATIEIYLSSLEKKLMNIEIPENKYNNLTREERSVLL